MAPLRCPFCDGEPTLKQELRVGYEAERLDPDAIAFYYRCNCCAATGGWAKSATGALRNWNRRMTP